MSLHIVARIVGVDTEGSPVMAEHVMLLNPDGPQASSDAVQLPAGIYRFDVLAPAAPALPATAKEIVDELLSRLKEPEDDPWR